MAFSKCLSCEKMIDCGPRPTVFKRVKCASCGAILEIIWVKPLELDWPLDEDDEFIEDRYLEFEDDDDGW